MDAFSVSVLSAVPFDPSGLLVNAAQDGDQIELVLQSPSVVSAAPHEGAGWSEALQDVFGTERPWRAGDPGLMRLWLPEHGLPTDMRCWVAVTAGPVSSSSAGVAIGLQGTTTGQQVVRGINTGTGWTIVVPAGKSPAEFILRAVSGTDIATLLSSHLPNLVGDYYRLAPDAPPAPGVVVIVQGEADAQVLAKAQVYEAQLDLAVTRIHAYWPAAPIVVQELVTTAATYPYHETVRAAQNAVAARYDYVGLSESEGLPTVADGVHLTPGAGGGYDQMAARITTVALGMLP